ncbi:MAG: YdcF family protein [Thermodesulfobacteriota bacterium]
MKKPVTIVLFLTTLVVFCVLALLYLDFIAFEDSPPLDSAAVRSDAIVVLTGGRGRIDEGLWLLQSGRAEVLILSGVNARAGLKDIFPEGLKKRLATRIILEKESRNTYENAIAVDRLLKARGFDSIILITSSYHMRRALFVLEHVLSKEVAIHPLSVSSINYDDNRWRSEKSLFINFSEFLKYSWFRLRFALIDLI